VRYRLYQWGWLLLDGLYPPQFGGCGSPGVRWCSECDQKTIQIKPPICPRCGQKTIANGLCWRCSQSLPSFDTVRSWAEFSGPIRNALHRLKYKRDVGLGDVLSQKLVIYLKKLDWKIDLITPVPLGDKRLKERGYNQSALLARPLAYAMGLSYNPRALKRMRETRSQVGLSLVQRQDNISEAFGATPEIVKGRKVLIIDDVTTSGATLKACSDAFLEAGSERLFGLTLAQAVFSSA
jgi:competence protein ComFC